MCHLLMAQRCKLSQGLAHGGGSSLRGCPGVGLPCSCWRGRPAGFGRPRPRGGVHSLSSVFESTEAFSIFWVLLHIF